MGEERTQARASLTSRYEAGRTHVGLAARVAGARVLGAGLALAVAGAAGGAHGGGRADEREGDEELKRHRVSSVERQRSYD